MVFPLYRSDTKPNVEAPTLPSQGSVLYTMTSEGELHLLFSQRGIQLHTDDIDPELEIYDQSNHPDATKSNFITQQIQYATSEVMSYLAPRYRVEEVYQIPMLRMITTYICAHNITTRRGNEPVYETEVVKGIDDLMDFRAGIRYLDAPSHGTRAYIQSGVVDNRFARNTWRVIPEASSTTIDGQKLIYRTLFAWL